MGIELPGELQWIAKWVGGAEWPKGDETALRRLADYWEDAAKELERLRGDGDAASKAVLAGMKRNAGEAFDQHWKQFTSGKEAGFPDLEELCEKIAKACRASATSIEYTKWSIIAALAILAAQIIALLAAAAGSFGTSTAGIPVALAAGRTLLMTFLRKLVEQIIFNVTLNLAVDGVIQGVQLGTGNRESWDWGKTGKALQAGVIAGVAGGAVAGGGAVASARAAGAAGGRYGTSMVTNEAGELVENTASRPIARATDAVIGVNSSGFAGAAGKGAASGAIGGSIGNSVNTGVNTGWDPKKMAESAVAGAAGGAANGAPQGVGTRHGALNETFFGGQGGEYRLGEGSPQHRNTDDGGIPTGLAANAERTPPANNPNDERDPNPSTGPQPKWQPKELNLP
ncbi:WXG100 family type VII secretion target [Amycolatopsis albispora]|uniref:Outer membrane channel protein CpnT-like N-terminal domain-containing protein n=1 Tax=Amycolatopsis albispora TaxID=1804986 RepID=A0A344L7N6_9PSEU|nr:hypothetical protein [Amycolatopsis albispora]AXB44060.1 hypothetical protein A4R43_17275 [Amycolatopsis albispora]